MTATAQEPPSAEVDAPPAEAVRVVRRPNSRRSNRRRRNLLAVQVATSVVFAAAVVVLGYVGYRATLLITGGTNLEVTDPEAPGFVAEVQPTPTDLVAITDAEGNLAAAVILVAGEGGSGGTVIPLPRDMSVPGSTGLVPPVRVEDLRTLEQVFADGGVEELRSRLGEALTFGFSSASVAGPEEFEALARMAGPISITSPDNLLELRPDESEVVRWRAGPVTLQPEEVLPFLSFGGSNESVPNQEVRHEEVWRALLGALEGRGPRELAAAGEPGDGEAGTTSPGLAALLGEVLSGDVLYESVPLTPTRVPGTIYIVYPPDAAALPAFVTRTIPSPASGVPGQRARVRVLAGTRDEVAVAAAVPRVVAAGGEVTLMGNAESFDEQTTRVEYVVPEARAAAEAIAAALGTTATRSPEEVANVDVDVVVGRDRSA